ncbi:MAG TPA: hypothetical protein VFD73_11275 [Gemmatimonadales bacterium]|jgi:hypothetical protein|nr:hypothetical protein [Gemmatimonadales bacterium]
MLEWPRNERLANTLSFLAGLTVAVSVLLCIAVPIITGASLLEIAIIIAVYLVTVGFICWLLTRGRSSTY